MLNRANFAEICTLRSCWLIKNTLKLQWKFQQNCVFFLNFSLIQVFILFWVSDVHDGTQLLNFKLSHLWMLDDIDNANFRDNKWRNGKIKYS